MLLREIITWNNREKELQQTSIYEHMRQSIHNKNIAQRLPDQKHTENFEFVFHRHILSLDVCAVPERTPMRHIGQGFSKWCS